MYVLDKPPKSFYNLAMTLKSKIKFTRVVIWMVEDRKKQWQLNKEDYINLPDPEGKFVSLIDSHERKPDRLRGRANIAADAKIDYNASLKDLDEELKARASCLRPAVHFCRSCLNKPGAESMRMLTRF